MTDIRTRQPIRLQPLNDIDPRLLGDEQSLVLASRNAYPVVAQAKRRGDGLGLAAGATAALLLGGVTFFSMSGHRAVDRPRAAPAAIAPAPALPPPMVASAPLRPQPAPFPILSQPPATPAAAPVPADTTHAPTMVFDGSSSPAPIVIADAPAPGGKGAIKAGVPAGGNGDDLFASRVGSESTDVSVAEHLSDPASTVTQGTLIPAVLETAIDTDLPGFVRAVVSQDVRSFDGRHVLIPRSSRLIGQYKSGLQSGQTRAYVIWQRLIRPDGVSVSLGSPAVDFSGTAGLSGKVDGHFMKRFGSAILLTVVGGLGALGSSGTSVVLSGGGQSAASVAAGRDGQIPPTIRVPQGQPIRVFTARDLDFSSVSAG